MVAIGNADTASITFGGVEFTTSDTQTFIADAYAINGTDSTFSSSNDNIIFTDGGADGEIVLADAADLTITTEVGGSGGGTITVEVPILGTAGSVATDVTMTGGSGAISVEDMGTDINDISLTTTGTISLNGTCLLYTSPSPRDRTRSRMPSSA